MTATGIVVRMFSGGSVFVGSGLGVCMTSGTFISQNYLRQAIYQDAMRPEDYNKKIMAEYRARRILDRTFAALGFSRIYDGNHVSWLISKDGHVVSISEAGRVFINNEFRCLVTTENNWNLPYGDMVLSKVLALCTKARKKINTLQGHDHKVLDRVLPLEECSIAIRKAIKEDKNENQSVQEVSRR